MNQNSLSLEETISEYTNGFLNKEILYNVISNLVSSQILKDIAYKIIDFISQFEDELVKIWNKPKFVLNSNYVITLDRIADKDIELIEELIKHKNFEKQQEEWKELGIIDEKFEKNQIFENRLDGKQLKKEYQHLPIDTKYFKDLELKILSLFDDLDNSLDGWLIKSENYQALNTILPKFKEKVQTIYIDPPFNTGDDFDYVDHFQDSTWLTLMSNRLEKAKDLLNKKGSLFLHLDYNANYYGRLILNQIFGKDNFRNEIVWQRTLGHHLASGMDVMTDYILWDSKTADFIYYQQYQFLNEEEIEEKFPYIEEETNRRFTHEKLEKSSNNYSRGEVRIIQGKKVNSNIGWVWTQETFDQRLKENPYCIYWTAQGRPRYKRYADEYDGRKIGNLWVDLMPLGSGTEERLSFDTQKPEALLKRIIESTSNKGDLVFDFFLGSGTTTAVAHKLGRKWLGVEMGEHFYTVVLPRMKKVLAYDKSGISKEKDVKEKYNKENAGGFFKYYELEQFENLI